MLFEKEFSRYFKPELANIRDEEVCPYLIMDRHGRAVWWSPVVGMMVIIQPDYRGGTC
jgi:hypothetical protein